MKNKELLLMGGLPSDVYLVTVGQGAWMKTSVNGFQVGGTNGVIGAISRSDFGEYTISGIQNNTDGNLGATAFSLCLFVTDTGGNLPNISVDVTRLDTGRKVRVRYFDNAPLYLGSNEQGNGFFKDADVGKVVPVTLELI